LEITRKYDPSGEENIALGSDGSGKEAALLSVKNVDRDLIPYLNSHLNCKMTKEKMRARELESTRTTSSFPLTKATCRMEIPAWLYHGTRFMVPPCPWSVLKVSSKTNM